MEGVIVGVCPIKINDLGQARIPLLAALQMGGHGGARRDCVSLDYRIDDHSMLLMDSLQKTLGGIAFRRLHQRLGTGYRPPAEEPEELDELPVVRRLDDRKMERVILFFRLIASGDGFTTGLVTFIDLRQFRGRRAFRRQRCGLAFNRGP